MVNANQPKPPFRPAQVTDHWLPYTNTLNQADREAVLRDVLAQPNIRRVYLDVVAAGGVTFQGSNAVKPLGNLNPPQDVLKQFDQLRRETGRTNVEAVAWVESWGYTKKDSSAFGGRCVTG
jgi:hypothetical protein